MRYANVVALVGCVGAGLLSGCDRDAGRGDGRGHEHEHGDDERHEHADDHPAGHDHHADDHGHEAAVQRVTRWQDGYELFAEHSVPIAGQPFEVLAHLTVLDGFTPLAGVPVELELSGPESLRVVAEEPDRPGIHRIEVLAPKPGRYAGRLIVRAKDEGVIGGFEVVVHADAAAAEAAARAIEHGDDSQISFLKEQQWKVSFATAFVAEGAVVPSVEVPGSVDTPPGGAAEVSAPVAGRIVAPAAGLPRPGQTVRAGELLANLAPAPASAEGAAQARLAVVEAEARARAARANLDRAERLVADEAISRREHEDARRELAVSAEGVQAARQLASLFDGAQAGRGGGSWKVSAPISGMVVRAEAKPGASVSPDDVLFTIVSQEELWLRARVPEQDAARLRSELDASYRVSGLDAWSPLRVAGEAPNASLVTVSPVVDPRTRAVEVIYALREPDPRLRIGGLVTLDLPVGEAWRGPLVPKSALVEQGGRSFVYVQADGEHFDERAVKLGPVAAGVAGIAEGVAVGERVVTVGANLVRLASKRVGGDAPHGHIH